MLEQPLTPLEPPESRIPWRGGDVAVMLITSAGLIFLLSCGFIFVLMASRGMFMSGQFALRIETFSEGELFNMQAPLYLLNPVIFVGTLYIFALRPYRLTWHSIGLRPTRWLWALVAILLGLLSAVITEWIGRTVQEFVLLDPDLTLSGAEDVSPLALLLFGVLASVFVPIAEELFFRGVLYDWLRGRWGVWVGVFASSVIFGVLHIALANVAAITILGVVLALIYERSKSLWPAIIVHGIHNGVKVVWLATALAAMS